MSEESISAIMDRFVNDPQFQQEFRADPKATAARYDFDLSEQELEAFESMDWSGSNEELMARVSKFVVIGGR
jgi:hypothetical protein